MTSIILDSSLKNYDLIEEGLLNQQPSFYVYQQRITNIYQSLINNHPEFEYRQYQVDDAALLCTRRNHVLTHGLGLGKTTITLLGILGLYWPTVNRRVGSIQIVVPNILSAQRWIEELERLNNSSLRISTYYQVIRTERDLLAATAPLLIYTQDFPKQKSKTLNGSRAFISRLIAKRYKPSMLVIDEVHNCQAGTKRSSHLNYLCRKAKRRVALTGTLTELPNVYQVCRLVYGDYFPFDSVKRFTTYFSSKYKIETNYTGRVGEDAPERFLRKLDPSKVPEYYDLMRRYVYRVRVDDPHVASCITLPKHEVVLHKVPPTEDQLALQDAYLKMYKHQMQLAAGNSRGRAEALKLSIPLIQVANCPTELSNKLLRLGKLVLQSPGKVIIFCHYVLSSRIVTNYLKTLLPPESVLRLYAKDSQADPVELNQQQRVDLVSEFQYSPDIKVGVFSFLAAESIDLTAATTVIYYCSGWSTIKVQQSQSRAVRPGNRNPLVKSHYLYTAGLIDEHQITLTTEKIAGSRLLMDYDYGNNEDVEDLSPAQAIRRLLGG